MNKVIFLADPEQYFDLETLGFLQFYLLIQIY